MLKTTALTLYINNLVGFINNKSVNQCLQTKAASRKSESNPSRVLVGSTTASTWKKSTQCTSFSSYQKQYSQTNSWSNLKQINSFIPFAVNTFTWNGHCSQCPSQEQHRLQGPSAQCHPNPHVSRGGGCCSGRHGGSLGRQSLKPYFKCLLYLANSLRLSP